MGEALPEKLVWVCDKLEGSESRSQEAFKGLSFSAAG